MALFNPCMKFEILGGQILSAMKVSFCDFIQNLSQAPFKNLTKWINGIILQIPHRNLKNIFV
jgi:hypothetical protein